ncbi:phytoene/squalene synthase family protein [Lysobacter koreensis]|uniref:Phytoene/squalene synthase family protein n=1 Tax=Lysobacter koreensis TaxID=266122 RepID=A0ABW2YK64_9GAMM
MPASSDADALATFVGKWRARWPEWSVAEVFVLPSQRAKALAWAALQQELTDAAWAGSDPRPGEAKLGWWQEELHGWSRGARRHPLGIALQREPAPWARLAASLPALQGSRARPHDEDEAFAALQLFADAASAVDAALFGNGDGSARLIGGQLLQQRLSHDAAAAVPLDVLARAGDGEGVDQWTQALQQRWPSACDAPRPRRVWAALALARLQRGDANRPLSAWRALWTAWRAARHG